MKDLLLTYSSLVVFGLAVLISVLSTVLPYFKSKEWYIRIFDYPRLQTFFIALIAFIWYISVYWTIGVFGYISLVLLAAIIIIQAYKAYPYTIFAKKQVHHARVKEDDESNIGILIANVLQTNNEYSRLIAKINKYNPDVVITTETNAEWESELSVIEKEYPHRVAVPKENLYGMHLYSKLPLEDSQVRYLLEPDYPSIRTKVQLRNKEWIHLFIVHPPPPIPGEANDSEERDAEIIAVGREAKKEKGGVIVAGDFNDVAWSETTERFQKVTGFLDPRRGRGFFNTFHAQYPIIRWPLDHIFHSKHFGLVALKRVGKIGSDHFPIFVKLHFKK